MVVNWLLIGLITTLTKNETLADLHKNEHTRIFFDALQFGDGFEALRRKGGC